MKNYELTSFLSEDRKRSARLTDPETKLFVETVLNPDLPVKAQIEALNTKLEGLILTPPEKRGMSPAELRQRLDEVKAAYAELQKAISKLMTAANSSAESLSALSDQLSVIAHDLANERQALVFKRSTQTLGEEPETKTEPTAPDPTIPDPYYG